MISGPMPSPWATVMGILVDMIANLYDIRPTEAMGPEKFFFCGLQVIDSIGKSRYPGSVRGFCFWFPSLGSAAGKGGVDKLVLFCAGAVFFSLRRGARLGNSWESVVESCIRC